MIEARRITGDVVACTSNVQKHAVARGPAVIALTIGDSHVRVCEECARDMLNALGFMVSSVTGKSLPTLLGLTKKRSGGRR